MSEIEAAGHNPLSRLSQARELLEASRDLSEVKSIRDVALAAEQYARAKKLGSEAERYAAEIATRAERRIGQLLAQIPRAPSGRAAVSSSIVEDETSPRRDIGYKTSARSQKLAAIPDDEFERQVATARVLSAERLARIQRDREAEQRRIEQARAEAAIAHIETGVELRHGDFRDVLADLQNVHAVITDPPYPREYLPLLADLAAWADKVLAADGVLAVLLGQSHLEEAYRLLSGYRPYRWTACYLTPGPSYRSFTARVHSNWKPLLIYGGGPRFADVIQAEGADAEAKSNHRWGQDYGGFHVIVERLTTRGQIVADPFAGSGTTLLAAKALGRHAVGADIDAAAVQKARERCDSIS